MKNNFPLVNVSYCSNSSNNSSNTSFSAIKNFKDFGSSPKKEDDKNEFYENNNSPDSDENRNYHHCGILSKSLDEIADIDTCCDSNLTDLEELDHNFIFRLINSVDSKTQHIYLLQDLAQNKIIKIKIEKIGFYPLQTPTFITSLSFYEKLNAKHRIAFGEKKINFKHASCEFSIRINKRECLKLKEKIPQNQFANIRCILEICYFDKASMLSPPKVFEFFINLSDL